MFSGGGRFYPDLVIFPGVKTPTQKNINYTNSKTDFNIVITYNLEVNLSWQISTKE